MNATGTLYPEATLLTSHSELQARAQLESVREMVAALHAAVNAARESDDAIDAAREAIQQDALSVEVRSNWETPDVFHMEGSCRLIVAAEFKILLCTGGPAVQIIGELEDGQPVKPRLQHQDWGTPWADYPLTSEDVAALLAYCSEFFFGE